MTFSVLSTVALLAVVVPHSAPPAATLAPHALHADAPTQSLERLRPRGVTSVTRAQLSAQAAAPPAERGQDAREVKLGRIPRPAPVQRVNSFGTAAVPIPTPPGQAVVAPGSGFFGFAGLTHADQRLAGTGAYANSQFSLEPPDQGLCVGNGYVMETVNNALAVYDTRGTRLGGPTALSEFFRVGPEFVRSAKPPHFGPTLSDPRCKFDVDTQRWFVTELEEDTNLLTGGATGSTSVFIAVSQTADPNGAYSLYAFDTTDAGGPGAAKHSNCPCLPDQPLLGADANGLYITTNEFPLFVPGFNGAQIYALSKRMLAAGNLPVVVHIDAGAISTGTPNSGIWYSIQPAGSPDAAQYSRARNGTEFFLSALDFENLNDNRIAVWALTNSGSLDAAVPKVQLQHVVISSVAYAAPQPAVQKAGPTPLGTALGDPLPLLNTNDDRMNQVVYAGGRLWSGVNTAVRFGSEIDAGIAYFVVAPQITGSGRLLAQSTAGGYVAVRGQNVMYPSIGVTGRGVPVMAFSLSGPDYFPSAAYVTASNGHAGNVRLAGPGSAPDDGFTAYTAYGGNGVGRWGDYSAAVADLSGNVWFAAEYIPNAPRTALANWGTFIGRVATH